MVAKSETSTFDFYLHKEEARTTICGSYWRSYATAYNVEIGNVICFEYDDVNATFEVFLYQVVDDLKVVKPRVSPTGMT
jgi:hypothetical protein